MTATELSTRVVAWLRRRPSEATIHWYGDGLDRLHPWAAMWDDIICDDIVEEVCCNWVWTIALPSSLGEVEGRGPCPLEFEWPPDLVEFAVWETDHRSAPSGNAGEVLAMACPCAGTLTGADVARLQDALNRGSAQRYVRGAGAWSPTAISRGLEWWAGAYAGREDLHFEWDPNGGPSPLVRELRRRGAVDVAERSDETVDEDAGDPLRLPNSPAPHHDGATGVSL
jgi:hypothetical protein